MVFNTFTALALFSILGVPKASGYPDCPSEGVSFVPDSDCTKYYICADGESDIFSCPEGLYFNPSIHECDYPANVPECSVNPTTLEPTSESTTQELPSNILRNCGETTIGNEGFIEYKLNETLLYNELCTFIIRSLNHSNFLFTLEENGFSNASLAQAISIFGFGITGHEGSAHLGPPNPLNSTFVEGSVVVVIVRSDGNSGTGFRLKYQALGEFRYGFTNWDDLIFSDVSGRLKYPLSGGNYLHHTGSVFVISNDHRRVDSYYTLNLEVSEVDLEDCCACDYLMVYSIDMESLLNEREPICYQDESRTFDTNGIYVLFFRADFGSSETGFTLEWTKNPINRL